jgi:hypothetical protein
LFSGWGAGQFGLVTVTPTVTLAGNISGGASIQDGIVAVQSGDAFKVQSGTITGAVDFADTANSNAGGGSCPSDPGGVCTVNSASVGWTGGTVTGVTLTYNAAVVNAVNEWNSLSTAWSTTTGSLAVNLHPTATYTLCAGSGQTGCTAGMTQATTTTRTVGGQTQTAYLFDISSTAGSVGGNITIKGDGSALVVLLYNNATALSIARTVSLVGLTSDQVLLNVTSTGGLTTAAGFSYAGSLAVKSATGTNETLTGSVINGRLFLGNTNGTGSLNSGFSLNAAGDVATPEPGTEILLGSALILLALVAKRSR